jgi:hypothetical protein
VLLKVVSRLLPRGKHDWQRVALEFSRREGKDPRNFESLKKKLVPSRDEPPCAFDAANPVVFDLTHFAQIPEIGGYAGQHRGWRRG